MKMNELVIQWVRVVLCGLVAGVVWFLLSAIVLRFFGQAFIDALQGVQPYPRRGGLFFFSIDLLMGIWALWLYTAIRSRYRTRAKTLTVVGFAWWSIKSLQSAKWAALGFVPLGSALAPLVATLPATIAATFVGAWLYEYNRLSHNVSRQ